MKWEPLISDESTKKLILERIYSIATDLALSPSKHPSLLGDNAGISIFWEYLFRLNGNNLHRQYSSNLINSSLDAIADTPMQYFFSSGVSGIMWTLSHLAAIGSIDVNLNEITGDEIHQFLANGSKIDIQHNNYDYLHGGLGILPYFLERTDNKQCSDIICDVISELEKVSYSSKEGITWLEGFHFMSKKEKRYNLGMAHGMPSIIVLLSKVLEKDLAPDKVEKLLSGAINWILDKEQQDGTNGLFPTYFPFNPPHYGRVSWCYGDLGIAIAILQAALVTKNNLWRDKAITIAINASKRRYDSAGIIDACFCHGTAGNAHIFNRLYQYTGMEEFKEAALYWYDETLRFYELNGHFKIFMRDEDGSNDRWENNINILEGTPGIGLVLIAAISDTEPKWDRCFLLS